MNHDDDDDGYPMYPDQGEDDQFQPDSDGEEDEDPQDEDGNGDEDEDENGEEDGEDTLVGGGGNMVVPNDVEMYDDPNDYDDEYYKKVSNHINRNLLIASHPELVSINHQELANMCKISRDSTGHIVDPLHTTTPVLTKYEKARVLGIRTKQLNAGCPPMIPVPDHLIDGYAVAVMELAAKQIPFVLQRTLPSGVNEFWRVADLEQL